MRFGTESQQTTDDWSCLKHCLPKKWKSKNPEWYSRRHETMVPNKEDGANSVRNKERTAFNKAKKAKKERKAKEKGLPTRAEIRAAKNRHGL